MALDLDLLRTDTSACSRVVHLNNAGASPSPSSVLEAMTTYLAKEASHGPMEAAEATPETTHGAHDAAARLLGCDADEVAVVGSQSRGFQLALAGVELRAGDRIITAPSEWGGNYLNLATAAARAGASLEVAPVDERGAVDPAALADMMDDRVRLVSLTWVPANGGLVNPAAAVGRVLAGSRALFFVDAAQAVGQMPVDVRAIGCDVLTASGRKWLRGPRGAALLHVRRAALDRLAPPSLDVFSAPWLGNGGYGVRSDARRYETSEHSPALHLGLRAAIDYSLALGLEVIRERVAALADRAREALSASNGVTVHDLGAGRRAGLVSFTVAGMEASEVRSALARAGINIGANGESYTPLDMAYRKLTSVGRLSPHYFNTEGEIEKAVEAIRSLAAAARGVTAAHGALR